MMITNEDDFRAAIEAALCESLETIRDAVSAGVWNRGEPVIERFWIMAARAYSDALDHIEGRVITSMSEPLWLVQADPDDALAVGIVTKWIAENKGATDEAFVFPDLRRSGDISFTVLFLTESKETAALFRTFYC